MEEIRAAKIQIRDEIANTISALSASEIDKKTKAIERRLFDFANFLESKIAIFLYYFFHEFAHCEKSFFSFCNFLFFEKFSGFEKKWSKNGDFGV